jgi:hypothetical protein
LSITANVHGLASVAEFGTESFRRAQNKLSKKNVRFAQNQQLSQAVVTGICNTSDWQPIFHNSIFYFLVVSFCEKF